MTTHRLHVRLDCEDRCHLHLGDSYYPAMVKNISLAGALVHFYDPMPGIQVGDNCKVRLGGDLTCEYNCEVVRVETSKLALSLIDMRLLDAVEH